MFIEPVSQRDFESSVGVKHSGFPELHFAPPELESSFRHLTYKHSAALRPGTF